MGVDYFHAPDAPIQLLIENFSFIRSKAHWGAAYRFGYLRVPGRQSPPHDCRIIDTAVPKRAAAD
jgi:hypothetical protein